MTGDLDRITSLAATLSVADARVTLLTDQLALAKADKRRIEEEDLPELMREVGLSEFKMDDGASVKVVDDVDCAITEERRAAAHDWLTRNGFGGLIKSELVVTYARDEIEAAREDAKTIEKITGHFPSLEERVHPATLKSFIKEQLAKGNSVPFDLFAIRPFAKAKITAAKAKKTK